MKKTFSQNRLMKALGSEDYKGLTASASGDFSMGEPSPEWKVADLVNTFDQLTEPPSHTFKYVKGPVISLNTSSVIDKEGSIKRKIKEIEDKLPSFISHMVSMNAIDSDIWQIQHPITVSVEEKAPDEYLACFYDADIYRSDETIPGAINALKEAMINQLEFLLSQEKEIELGPIPLRQLNILKQLIVPKVKC